MKKVFVYSLLLVAGLVLSQVVPPRVGEESDRLRAGINLLTLVSLSFIMIHVGFEFELDRSRLRGYLSDFGVAASAAILPWIFCSLYLLFVMAPARDFDGWRNSFLTGCFAAPTSAGILFAMLAAAGLSSTWVFGKARVLAIFDDLVTVLLLIPLKMMVVGAHWQLGVIAVVIATLLCIAWRFFHRVRIPTSWPWILAYSILLVGASEAVYLASLEIESAVPIHIEVLLPAFVLGCVLACPREMDPHVDDAREGHQEGPTSPAEQRVSSFVSGLFMVLVGLSMPPLMSLAASTGWGLIALHTLAITLLSNVGKMFPLLCYRGEAIFKERLALCLGMWPRGEVGAGVLILSLGYGIGGAPVAVATLSLAVNLVGTGLFIAAVKKLLRSTS